MNILILGNSQDAHALAMQQGLTKAGATADYFDTLFFTNSIKNILAAKNTNRKFNITSRR